MHTQNSDYYFLRGGGEMGELIRAKDWRKTGVGDPADWSPSLRTTMGILLNSKFPTFLFWGSQLTCFYNDAYRPSLGIDGKHPAILGMPAVEAWVEIWDIIKPLIDKVMNEAEAVWFEDSLIPIYRNGKIEDVYWTFSYSPVMDNDGKVAGVLVTCVETTEKVEAVKKIAERDQRFRNNMKQAPVGITILRGPEYEVEMANEAYLQLVDKKEEEFVGKKLFTALPEVEDTVNDLLKNVLNSGEPFHGNEVPVPINRDGKKDIFYFDFLYHPLREEDGKISGIFVAVTESTEKVAARKKIEERKRLYETITQNTPDLIYVFDLNYRFQYANNALLNMWGRTWEDAIGKSLLEVGYEPWHAEMHEREIDEIIKTKKPVRGEVSFPHATLGTRFYDYILVPVIDEAGNVEAISGNTRDITQQVEARKQIEESDEKLRSLIENAPFPIGVFAGKEMRIEVANETIINAWGKGHDVIGKLFRELMPELESQQVFEQIEGVFTTGKPFHKVNQRIMLIINGKEQPYYYNYSFTPLFDASGNVYGVMNTASDVTDLNVAKKSLEESEQDLRSMALQAPIGICILDAATLTSEIVNDSFVEIAGKPREEILGKYYWDTFAEAKNVYASALDKVVKEGSKFFVNETALLLIRHDKEETIYVSFVYAPLKDDEGNVKKVAVWVLDNTQQVMARKKIEEDTEKLNIVIDASELGTWELNLKTKEPIYSKRYLEILGGYKEEIKLTHAQLLKHLHPDDMPIREKAFKDAIASGYLHYEARLIWKDNSIHWMEGKGKVFYDEENNPIKLIGTIRDITEVKNYQEELKESEEQFKMLADQAPMWVWLTDKEVNVLYTNPEVLKFLGIAHYTDFTGQLWEQKVHPDDIAIVYKSFSEAAMLQQSFSFEFRVLNAATQQYEWFYLKAVPRWESGECTGFIGTGININEQKSFAKELQIQVSERTKELEASNTELEKMNKELKSFAYISSHDLQEPLRKIQTFVSRIVQKEEKNLSEFGLDMFIRIQDSAKRMQILIQDLLAYSRTNTNDRKLESTDLNKIVAEVKEDLEEELLEKQAIIEADQLCVADIIPFQFRQLMINLIGNSLKFSQPDKTPHIIIKCEIASGKKLNNQQLSPQKNYCHISIADNGIGFDPQYSEKIFELFQRLHGKNEYNGTGIGLSIVKKIVENHNGIITASSQPNKGATFEIYIPAK